MAQFTDVVIRLLLFGDKKQDFGITNILRYASIIQKDRLEDTNYGQQVENGLKIIISITNTAKDSVILRK